MHDNQQQRPLPVHADPASRSLTRAWLEDLPAAEVAFHAQTGRSAFLRKVAAEVLAGFLEPRLLEGQGQGELFANVS